MPIVPLRFEYSCLSQIYFSRASFSSVSRSGHDVSGLLMQDGRRMVLVFTDPQFVIDAIREVLQSVRR